MDRGKTEFQGDVGQAVLGNVTEAPRLENVVHLNIGKSEPQEKIITRLQRQRISQKVKELMALSGQGWRDVYAVLLTDFNAANMKEFPQSRYQDALSYLDHEIGKFKPAAVDAAVTSVKPTKPEPCSHCAEAGRRLSRSHFWIKVQSIAIVGMLFVVAWLLWMRPGVAAADAYCHLDGKTYSSGSAIKMPDGALRECTVGPDDDAPHWNEKVAHSKKRMSR